MALTLDESMQAAKTLERSRKNAETAMMQAELREYGFFELQKQINAMNTDSTYFGKSGAVERDMKATKDKLSRIMAASTLTQDAKMVAIRKDVIPELQKYTNELGDMSVSAINEATRLTEEAAPKSTPKGKDIITLATGLRPKNKGNLKDLMYHHEIANEVFAITDDLSLISTLTGMTKLEVENKFAQVMRTNLGEENTKKVSDRQMGSERLAGKQNQLQKDIDKFMDRTSRINTY